MAKFRAAKASLRARLHRAKMNALNALKSQQVAQLLLLLGVYLITYDDEQTEPKVPRSRKQRIPNKERTRMNWSERVATLTDAEFMRTYRVDKVLFNELLEKIRQPLEIAEPAMARNSEPVSPELKLSMTLRWLAGGSYLDIYQMHGVSYTQFNKSLWMTIDAINDAIIISFPIDDLSALLNLEQGFAAKSNSQSLRGCVGAVDGCLIRIRPPNAKEDSRPKRYYSRFSLFEILVFCQFTTHQTTKLLYCLLTCNFPPVLFLNTGLYVRVCL